MRLPSQKRIMREDLKGAEPWINPLLDVVNNFMESVYQALNKNITFSENIAGFIREMTYVTPATYPVMPIIDFQNTMKVKASGILLMQVYETQTYRPPPGPVYIPWIEDNGTIRINTITGLEASKTYTLRLLVI